MLRGGMKKPFLIFIMVALLVSTIQSVLLTDVYALTMDVWTSTSYVNVFKDTTKPGGASTDISWVAAKNEYESAQIVLRADSAFTINSVTFTNLTGGGNTINSSNLKYKFVGYQYLSSNSSGITNYVRSGAADYPEYLSNESTISVSANITQPVWITVYIPKTAVAATYTGTVTVNTSIGSYNASISLEVNDVQIPDTDDANFNLYFWQWTAGWYNKPDSEDQIKIKYGYDRYSTEWWALMDKFAQSAKEHRLNHYFIPTVTLLDNGGTTVDDNGVYSFDWSRFDEVIQFFMDRGWIKGLVGNQLAYRSGDWTSNYEVFIIKKVSGQIVRTSAPIGSADANNWLSQFLPALNSHLQSKGWLSIWSQHLADEPANQAQADQWVSLWNSLNTYASGMKAIEAIQNQTYVQQYIDKMDIWIPKIDKLDQNISFYNSRLAAGDRVWYYTTAIPTSNWLNRLTDQPVWMGRSLIWYCYKRNLDGYLHWAWNAWHYDWSSFTAYGNHATVFPDTANADIKGSIRHEAIRDGAEDYELFKILETRDASLANSIVGSIVTTGTSYSTNRDTMISKRNDLVRAAAGTTPTPTPTPTPGTLFSDDFEDGNSTGWTPVGGSWSVLTDGSKVYKQTDTAGEAISYAGNSAWTDYTVEVRIKLYDLDIGDASGILARYSDSSNYYMLRLGNSAGTTKVQLYKRVGGNFTLLNDALMTVNTNQWYTLKLVLNGSSLTGYVDGVPKVSATDSSLTSGCIGTRSYMESFAVDDVVVTAPSLFSDDFEDGDSNDWIAVNGTWSVVTDGTKVYKQTAIAGEAISYAGSSAWADYTIEAKIKLYDLDAGDASGILARYYDSNNYYIIRLGNSAGVTKVQLYKKVGGTFTLLDDEIMTVNTNQWYTLKLVLNGSSLTGFVDGVQQVSAADSSLTSGCIGVRSYTESFAVDDVVVN